MEKKLPPDGGGVEAHGATAAPLACTSLRVALAALFAARHPTASTEEREAAEALAGALDASIELGGALATAPASPLDSADALAVVKLSAASVETLREAAKEGPKKLSVETIRETIREDADAGRKSLASTVETLRERLARAALVVGGVERKGKVALRARVVAVADVARTAHLHGLPVRAADVRRDLAAIDPRFTSLTEAEILDPLKGMKGDAKGGAGNKGPGSVALSWATAAGVALGDEHDIAAAVSKSKARAQRKK